MTIRFHRSIKLFPGVHLNIGKKGLGISVGRRGLHVGVSTTGKPYVSAGLPGTGIYMRQDGPKLKL